MQTRPSIHRTCHYDRAQALTSFRDRVAWKPYLSWLGMSLMGVVAPFTLQATAGYASEFLSYGSSGPEVAEVQQKLRNLGYSIPVDGVFGYDTEQAVKALQTACGLHIDGVVGEDTALFLDNGCAGRTVSFPGGNQPGGSGTGSDSGGIPSYLRGRFVVMLPTDSLEALRRVRQYVPEAFINRYAGRFGPFIQVAVYDRRDRFMAESQYRYLQRQGLREAHMRLF